MRVFIPFGESHLYVNMKTRAIYHIAGKFGGGKFCKFTLFEHLAKKSLAN